MGWAGRRGGSVRTVCPARRAGRRAGDRADGVLPGVRPRGRRHLRIGDSGRLMIVAADHPARGALGVGDRRLAMAN
ncbi:Cgl0159 family (beta/alpha)8-fold protein, partial [Streptomyces sp. NPDC003730]